MNYGILTSGSCLLTDIIDQLHEPSKKLAQVKKWCPDNPVVHIYDSDVVKPDGYKFEFLGWVCEGSESTPTKNVYKKGYHVTETTVLTKSNHPVSIFSEIHSSKEKDFSSTNTVTFSAMERAAALFKKATFVMDRGYDNNKMFLKLDSMGQDYVIRLTAKRKLLYHNQWGVTTELRNRRKGNVKLPLFYKSKMHDACNKQKNQIQRRCNKGYFRLLFQMED